jgi:hypothetical protein
MSDIVKGLGNMVASIFQVIQGAITTVVNVIVTAFQSVFDVIVSTFKGVFNLAEGVVGLVVGKVTPTRGTKHKLRSVPGNFLMILVAGAAYFGYIEYQKRQGNRNPQPLKNVADAVSKKLE